MPNTRHRHSTARAPKTGTLYVLSGPSGVGKDTVMRKALPQLRGVRLSVSVTTRDPRPREREGVDYFFIDEHAFRRMLERGDLLEHAVVHGNYYGTPRGWVEELLRAGTDVLLCIDVQGALQVKAAMHQAILVFLAPPSWDELERRLRSRNTEDEETVMRRLNNARAELARVDQYEYLIVNDHLADAVASFRAIVIAERCRPQRQNLDIMEATDA